MDKLQIHTDALSITYGIEVAQEFTAAWNFINNIWTVDLEEVDPPRLLIGGFAKFGKYRGAYRFGANAIHVPTELERSVAKLSRNGSVVSVDGKLKQVLAHELMHFLEFEVLCCGSFDEYQHKQPEGHKYHASSYWLAMVMASEFQADPELRSESESDYLHKLMFSKRRTPQFKALYDYLKSYVPPIDSKGVVLARPSEMLPLQRALEAA